jgi:uncharacterized protein YkwD
MISKKRPARGLVVLLLVALVFIFILAPSAQAVTYSADEVVFVTLINGYRVSQGLQPLLVSDMLSEAGDRHSSDMGKYSFFSHTTVASDWFPVGASPWDRMAASGYTYATSKAENIAAGYPTAADVFLGWKNSSGHNANMLGASYQVLGISLVYTAGSPYGYYWTTDFGGYVDPTAHSLTVPTITGLSPTRGPTTGGTSVVITGTNFTGATGVSFGGVAATSYTFDTDTQITATAPAHAAATVGVQVTSAAGASADTSADDYTYVVAPTIGQLYPSAGPLAGGNRLVIVGTGFSSVAEVRIGTAVLAPADYVVDSSTRITIASVPAQAAGIVQVRVTSGTGFTLDTPSDDYTYTATPTQVDLTTAVSGSGAITRTPNKSSYYLGELVSVEAVPDSGWGFVGWSGDLSGAGSVRELVMDAGKSATAAFSDTVVELQIGWNLVAAAPGTVFGDVLFGWNGSTYASVTDPTAWQGYWLRASSTRTVYIATAPGPQTVSLATGWNLVGNPMDSAAALTLPSGRMAFIYDAVTKTYVSISTLEPGQGAWIKGAAGELVVFTAVP